MRLGFVLRSLGHTPFVLVQHLKPPEQVCPMQRFSALGVGAPRVLQVMFGPSSINLFILQVGTPPFGLVSWPFIHLLGSPAGGV